MSLPPDPHDDDVAGYDTPPPPPPPTGPDHAPPPTGGPRVAPEHTPGSLSSGVETHAPAAPAPAPPPPVPPPAAPPAPSDLDSPPDGRDLDGAAGGGRRRLAPLLLGAAALALVAGAAVALTGSDDADTAAPASEQSPADAETSREAEADEADEPSANPSDQAGEIGGADDGAVDGGESPVEVAEAFFEAVAESDCTGVVGRLTPESYGPDGASAAEAIADCEDDGAGTSAIAEASWDDIALVSEDGDEATVSVTVSVGTEEATQELPMRRIDGEWLMDFDTSVTERLG